MTDPELSRTLEETGRRLAASNEHRHRLSEADTIRGFIIPVLRALGWRTEEFSHLRSEYRHQPSDNPVDCALFLQDRPVLFVEAKALGVDLNDRRWILQTLNYANTSGVGWCVLTNGEEWRIYNVHHKAEAEQKLFLSLRLGAAEEPDYLAGMLSLMGPKSLEQHAIDRIWQERLQDQHLLAALGRLESDPAFFRLLRRHIGQDLTLQDIRATWARIAPWSHSTTAAPRQIHNRPAEPEKTRSAPVSERKKLPRTDELFAAGILRPGMPLSIRNRPDSTATVIDGKRVSFDGQVLSYSEWGCRVTGWTAIQIYTHAETTDGALLHDLRSRLA